MREIKADALIQEIAETLAQFHPESIQDIANKVLSSKVTYVGPTSDGEFLFQIED